MICKLCIVNLAVHKLESSRLRCFGVALAHRSNTSHRAMHSLTVHPVRQSGWLNLLILSRLCLPRAIADASPKIRGPPQARRSRDAGRCNEPSVIGSQPGGKRRHCAAGASSPVRKYRRRSGTANSMRSDSRDGRRVQPMAIVMAVLGGLL